ncbi:MAG: imidazolonepropionase [Anaerolineales bacterium]
MPEADLLIHSASQVLTLEGGPQRGQHLGALGMIKNGGVAITQGKISAVGPSDDLREQFKSTEVIDASGQVVMPGLIDPHTHLIWMGDRAQEFEMRLQGASYMEIMQAGGGIVSTVRQTREASVEQLKAEARPRIRELIRHGTTTVEGKTGYGLQTEAELRMLQALLELDAESTIEIVPTFLGAHAIPLEYKDDSDGYTRLMVEKMLPEVKRWWQQNAAGRGLPFVDVFCETGAFNLQQSRAILEKAKALGFPLKIHADEFDGLGGTALAVELGAVSADHLVKTPSADIAALGGGDTVAVGLPCTPFGLAESEYTPAQAILEAGGTLALASDLNPGTAWCGNMQFTIALACRYMRLTPAQAIAASTINAAAALACQDRIGSLEAGKQADILLLEVPDYRHLGYRFGTNLVSKVMKSGKLVYPFEEV